MFLSLLHVNVGDDPDRPRPGRKWLRNMYHVHQRLCMAFPSSSQKQRDTEFLAPFDPTGFQHVHGSRTAEQAFLFRVEPLSRGMVGILVQSAIEPDWEYAFHNAPHLLAEPAEKKAFSPQFATGQYLRFRLLANPTRRLSERSLGGDGQPVSKESIGKRVPVPTQRLCEWLEQRSAPSGFSVQKDSTTIEPGYIHVNNTRSGNGRRYRTARYDGILEITDPEPFTETVISGIGRAKAFGCGLLSVAPTVQ